MNKFLLDYGWLIVTALVVLLFWVRWRSNRVRR